MGRLEDRVLAHLFPEGDGSIEARLFRGLSLLGGMVAFFVILPLNAFQDLFPLVNVLVALFGVAAFGVHIAARKGRPLYGRFFFLILALLDLIWFGNAGSEGSIGMFFFAAALYLVIFFQGYRRWLMLGLFLVNGSGLYLAERAWPHLITRFPDPTSRFVDLLGSFIVCNLMCVLILWVVLTSYHREHQRQVATAADLRESEARFRSLLEDAPVPMMVTDREGRILDLNRAFVQVLGYTLEDLPDASAWWARAYPDPEARLRAFLAWKGATEEALESGLPVPPTTFEVTARDGSALAMEIRAALIGGRWLVMFTDLTPRRATEAALRESEASLRRAQEAAQVGTFTWDMRADQWTCSPVMERILGLTPDHPHTLEGWVSLVRPDFREPMQRYVAEIVSKRASFDQDYPVVGASDGVERWVYGRGEIDYDQEGRPLRMVGTIQDISAHKRVGEERRMLEAQVHRAQKMESLGSLAGGVAHDMNNVLGAILGMASAQQTREAEGSPGWKAMDTITRACVRGRTLVKGLLDFTRQDLSEERLVDLNALVEDQVSLLEHSTLGLIRLETCLGEALQPIRGDAAALSHALMNLCVNAVDAMPEGGRLWIQTRNAGGDRVELKVVDTGIGMPPHVMERALDPFFTTKPQGKGTGLGLSIVYGTVKAHRGQMTLDSQPGQGTQVTLNFPSEPSLVGGGRGVEAVEESPRRLRLLVVDDDPLIRESLLAVLGVLGHDATEASSGEAGLAQLEAGVEADGVILDLNMPGLGGAGTLPRLRILRPDLPVILATGRADQAAFDLAAQHARVSILPKPFSLAELRSQLGALG